MNSPAKAFCPEMRLFRFAMDLVGLGVSPLDLGMELLRLLLQAGGGLTKIGRLH